MLLLSWADQVSDADYITQKPEDDRSEGCCFTLIDNCVCDERMEDWMFKVGVLVTL